jgi:hypothetical protein
MTNKRKPASEFKVTKLKRSGPKPGQSLNSYMYGQELGQKEWEQMAHTYQQTGKKQATRLIKSNRKRYSK